MGALESGLVYEEDSASVVWGGGLVVESADEDMEVCGVCAGELVGKDREV